jgi:uncharacterized LabA/DUF88 family protein
MPDDTKRLWLIDAGYLFNAQRTIGHEYHFDYLKLRKKIEETKAIWRAYYINSTPNPPQDAQDQFHSWLRCGPPRGPKIITQLHELKSIRANYAYCEDCGKTVKLHCPEEEGHRRIKNQQQKGVDVGIATLALIHREKYDALLLSSGDGDLLDAVEFLSEFGKRIELLVFRNGVSTDLQSRADEILWIDEFAEDIRRDEKTSAQPAAGAYDEPADGSTEAQP